MAETFTITVNGEAREVSSPADRTLLEVLREDLGLTGAKYGCGEGRCRSCTVLVEGKPTLSCVTGMEKVNGKQVTTVEGLAEGDTLHPVQAAFVEESAMQCGYCIPGYILQTVALLEHNASPSDKEIIDWLNPSMCRCTNYPNIMRAVRRAAGRVGA